MPSTLYGEVSRKAKGGVSVLFLRQMLVIPLSALGAVVLARFLSPAEFGTYAVASFVINFTLLFADLGLGPALIRQADEPTLSDWRTVFTLQSLLVGVIAAVWFLLAPRVVAYYRLTPEAVWMFRGLCLVSLLAIFRTVPVLMLERRLDYHAFARADVLQAILYQGCAIGLAATGHGIWSFIVALGISNLAAVSVLALAAPWRIGFAWSRETFARTLRFGAWFQLSNLTAPLRDNLVPLLAGPLFGPQAVGLLNWAHNTALMPSQVFTQLVARVSFPAFSKLQDDSAAVAQLLEKALRFLNLASFPLLALLAALIPEVVTVVFTDKWAPGIAAFWCYALVMTGGNFTTLFDAALKAKGHADQSFRVMAVWTLACWAGALLLIPTFGYMAIPLAYLAAILLPATWLYRKVTRFSPVSLDRAFWRPLGASAVAGSVAYFAKELTQDPTLRLGLGLLLGGLAYLTSVAFLDRQTFQAGWQGIRRLLTRFSSQEKAAR